MHVINNGAKIIRIALENYSETGLKPIKDGYMWPLNQLKGEDFYDVIVAIDPGIAIFPMSGCITEEIEERFAGKAIAGIITKPFSPASLMETITEGFARKPNENIPKVV